MITLLDYLYGIKLPSGALISELTDATPKPNIEVLTAMCAGDTMPQFLGGHGAKPQIDFSTPQIKTVLDACGMLGYDASAGNLDLHYRSGRKYGTRAATGLRIRMINSLLWWTQLSARQNGAAEITCSVAPAFDGTNPPMTPAGAVAVPAMSALPQEFYTLGPVSINGYAVAGVEEWSLDLGVKTQMKAADGESYPSWIGVESHSPVLTVKTAALAAWATTGVGGLALTALEFYLRKKKLDNAGCEANGSAVHVKFAATKGVVYVEQSSGGAEEPAACTLKVHLRKAAPTDAHALTVSTASAIV